MFPVSTFPFPAPSRKKEFYDFWSSLESAIVRDKVVHSFDACLNVENVLIMGACRLMTMKRLIGKVHWKPTHFSDEACKAPRMGESTVTKDWKSTGECSVDVVFVVSKSDETRTDVDFFILIMTHR